MGMTLSVMMFFVSIAHAVDEKPNSQETTKHPLAEVMERSELSQYGITWKFEHPVKTGQFVNGDWWVVGPVTVASVTPEPTQGPLEGEVSMSDAIKEDVKDIKGRMQFILGWVPPDLAKSGSDNRMRNGSMVIDRFDSKQGYDSRIATYDPSCSITFPYKLEANRTLISSISQAYPISDNFCHQIMWRSEKKQRSLLRAVAVLTCLASEPPSDAFRPPYAGKEKPIYRACEVATGQDFERFFQRPWISHYGSANGFDQVLGYMQPSENQPSSYSACFGREDTRLVSIASLMLHLDVPKARKEKLLIGMVQRGIDISGMFKTDRVGPCAWIQSGCKWPPLFASLMLDRPELRQFPEPVPFHEDVTTYYGTGWFGQTALWRIVWHDHLIDSEEEHSPEQMTGNDGISYNYRSYGSSGKAWLGTALSVRLMKGIKIWGHDAFFDYCDRWIDEDKSYTEARGVHKKPVWETNTWEPFVTAMWKAYRKQAPMQEMSGKNLKAEWEKKEDGWHCQWVANPKPDPKEVAEHVDAIHKAFPQAYSEAKNTTQ